MSGYTPPNQRTPEQVAAMQAAEREVANVAEAATRPAIGNSADEVQMVIAYIVARASGSQDSLEMFCRQWRIDRGRLDERRIENRAG